MSHAVSFVNIQGMENADKSTGGSLADRLRAAIEATGKSPTRISKEAGLSPSWLGKVLSGETTSPRVQNMEKLAAALDLTYAELMGFDVPGVAQERGNKSVTGDVALHVVGLVRDYLRSSETSLSDEQEMYIVRSLIRTYEDGHDITPATVSAAVQAKLPDWDRGQC